MIEQISSLLKQGLLVAVLGGVFAYILSFIIGPIQGMAFGGTIVAFIALLLVLYMKAKTGIEALDLFSFAVLLLVVGIVGSLIVGILPAAAPFIFTLDGALTIQALVWTFVYIGVAMWIEKNYL
jgi:hypothetical protein